MAACWDEESLLSACGVCDILGRDKSDIHVAGSCPRKAVEEREILGRISIGCNGICR